MCIFSQVVFKLESETQRKMRSKGLQEGEASGPEAEASADGCCLSRLRDQTPRPQGKGTGRSLRSVRPRDIPSLTGVGGGDVSTQLL